MEQFTVRYVSELDFTSELNKIHDIYQNGNYNSILFHVYSGVLDEEHLTHLSQMIRDKFNTENIIGTISAGEIKEGKLMDRGVLVSALLFENSDIKVFRYPKTIGNEHQIGKEIRELVDGINDMKAVELMFPGTNLNTRDFFLEISKCNPNIQFFGGYAGGHFLDVQENYVFDYNGLYDQMLFVVTYAGKDLHVNVDKSVGWQTLGMPFKVTKADGNRLIEVNDRPAVELYEKYMQIKADENFAEETFEFPLMAQLDGEEILRHTMAVEEDGTLVLAGYVTEGMDIYLCYGAPADIVHKVDIRLNEVGHFQPEAILLYSCSVRKAFWEDFVNVEMLPFQKIAETAGFHTWGEVNRDKKNGNVLEYNITLMSIAMREGEPKRTKPILTHVDDSVLKGQAALINRLTKLVYATTTELQKAYNDMSVLNDKLVVMAEHDGLTGIYNRRTIENMIDQTLKDCGDSGVSLVMLDIDHFKLVNDTYGHDIGDVTLKTFARFMKNAAAKVEGGAVGRWGGEEFMMVLPNINKDTAYDIAEQMRKDIEGHLFEVVKHVTVSMGVIKGTESEDRKEMYIRLDDALYKAKNSGRNRVVMN